MVKQTFNKRQNEIPVQDFPIHPTLATHLSQNNTSQQFVACKHYLETKQSPSIHLQFFTILFQKGQFLAKKKQFSCGKLNWQRSDNCVNCSKQSLTTVCDRCLAKSFHANALHRYLYISICGTFCKSTQ